MPDTVLYHAEYYVLRNSFAWGVEAIDFGYFADRPLAEVITYGQHLLTEREQHRDDFEICGPVYHLSRRPGPATTAA